MKKITDFLKNNRLEFISILTIALPTIVDLFVQTLLGFFDLVMVGKLGNIAISSVGIGSAPILTITPLFFAVSIGTTAIISRAYGAKNFSEVKDAMKQSVILGIPISIVITLIFIFFGKEILELISQKQSVDLALEYMKQISLGIPFLCFNIIFAYAFRAINKSYIPMYNNMISIVLNIALNYIFIFKLNLGVVGAGVATTLARGFVTLGYIYLLFFTNKYCISLKFRELIIEKLMINRLLKIGIPAACEQTIFRVGMLIFEAFVINLGVNEYTAHKIALTAESFSFNLGFGFSVAGTALVGQHLGAKNIKMAKKTAYLNAILALILMSSFGVMFMFFPKLIISFFTQSKEIIPLASSALRIVSVAQPILAISMIFSGALRGAGDTKTVMYITSFGMFGIRIPLTYFLLYKLNLGLNGAWYVMIVDLSFRGVVCYLKFAQGKWQTMKV